MAMADLRREYSLGGLNRSDLAADPITQFSQWFVQASGSSSGGGRLRKIGIALYKLWQAVLGRDPADVNAMTLATVDKEGRPSARMVLLKGVDERGFIFFTNYDSRKGRDLAEDPNAALVFYWPDLERQVCVSGLVSRLPQEESEAYFASRPKGSRIAAWASSQSEVVPDRKTLEEKWRQMAAKFPGESVPLPSFWGGYVLAPTRLEFWQGRPNRLHDRFRYTKQADISWNIERLAP
jgi:pyridoxamine 5'-phosphate oxidase